MSKEKEELEKHLDDITQLYNQTMTLIEIEGLIEENDKSACKDCNKYEFQHKRKSLLSNSKGSYTSREFEELLKKNPVCPICKRKWDQIPLPKHLKVPWAADHIVPINPVEGEKKGTNYISNIQPLCFSCNSKKGNRQ